MRGGVSEWTHSPQRGHRPDRLTPHPAGTRTELGDGPWPRLWAKTGGSQDPMAWLPPQAALQSGLPAAPHPLSVVPQWPLGGRPGWNPHGHRTQTVSSSCDEQRALQPSGDRGGDRTVRVGALTGRPLHTLPVCLTSTLQALRSSPHGHTHRSGPGGPPGQPACRWGLGRGTSHQPARGPSARTLLLRPQASLRPPQPPSTRPSRLPSAGEHEIGPRRVSPIKPATGASYILQILQISRRFEDDAWYQSLWLFGPSRS